MVIVLSDTSSKEQMKHNITTFDKGKKLSSAHLDTLAKAAQLIKMGTAIPCISCRYYEKDCPQHLEARRCLGDVAKRIENK